MVPLDGDVPGRRILFGMVPGELPAESEPEFDMRTNRLLLLAVQNMQTELASFLERHGADRVAIVLGASNTGIDEAQRNVDRWLEEGTKLLVTEGYTKTQNGAQVPLVPQTTEPQICSCCPHLLLFLPVSILYRYCTIFSF